MRGLIAAAVVLIATPVAAQRIEVSPLVGLTLSTSLENKAPTINSLRVAAGFTWGVEGTWLFSPHLGVEGLFTQQPTDMTITSGGVSAELFEMTVTQYLGNVVYQPGPEDSALRLFVFGGLGATVFSADDFDSETKFAWTVGAGVKWFPASRLGARFHLRYKPTMLNDSSSGVCDPFGFCESMLHQMELAAGAILRF
jgi:opacity protein-like surface antigen